MIAKKSNVQYTVTGQIRMKGDLNGMDGLNEREILEDREH